MGYSSEIYSQSASILADRRKNAIELREKHRDEVREKSPEYIRIEKEMAETGLAVTKVMLSGGDVAPQMQKLRETNIALKMERSELLRLMGLPSDYLDYKFMCKECEDTGFVDGKICQCHLDLLKKLTFDKINEATPLSESTFKRFDVSYYPMETDESGISMRSKMRIILQFCMDYSQSFNLHSKSIFMCGETGLGKTHLGLAIANKVIANGFSVEYGSAQNIFGTLEKEYFSRKEDEKGRYENLILNTDLLIIDDLGAEFSTAFTVASLYNIVNTRLLADKPVIISTNISSEEMESKYTRRITSRIFGNYELLGFVGRDIRQLKAMRGE